MNVLIIPEDFRKDQYILKPIIEAMMKAVGKPKTVVRVQVCQEPRLGGVDQALNVERLAGIVERYRGMVQLFLLCVDRDGQEGRRKRLDEIEESMSRLVRDQDTFLAVNAWQELEVWILAGHKLPKEWNWKEIREELHPKERYFLPFARQQRVDNGPGEGRKTLALQAARRYAGMCRKCPEDLLDLEHRIKELSAL